MRYDSNKKNTFNMRKNVFLAFKNSMFLISKTYHRQLFIFWTVGLAMFQITPILTYAGLPKTFRLLDSYRCYLINNKPKGSTQRRNTTLRAPENLESLASFNNPKFPSFYGIGIGDVF